MALIERATFCLRYSFLFSHISHYSSTMPRRSPSPGSYKRYRNSDDRDKYRGRRDDAASQGYRRNADRESRDGYRDRRGYPERDTRRSYHDDKGFDDNGRRRRDDGDDDRHGRKNGYDSHDDGRRGMDEGGGKDHRYASRHDEKGDDKGFRRGEYRDRGDRDRLRDDRDRRERGDERRSSSRRRSASPRRSRPHSRSPSPSRSRSPPPPASPPPEDKTKPNFAPSGLLAAATNTVKHSDGTSTLLKYNEPPEARKPLVGWRLYVFKGDEQVGAPSRCPSIFPSTTVLTSNTRGFCICSITRCSWGCRRFAPYTSPKCVPRGS